MPVVLLILLVGALPVRGADAEQLLSVDALKQMSLQQLLDVKVTTVSRSPERLLDTPSAIQVITSDDIARSGALTLPQALRLAPNLEVAQKNPHDWGISARGFNAALANKLLVMIDGRTVYTPLFSGVFWDVQDYLLADIDRIEVVSGPGATLWGANAVNGVINVITKSAKDTQGLYTEAGAGNEVRDFAAVRYGAQLAPNAYVRVYGKTIDEDNAVLANGTPAHDSWTMNRGGFRLDADLNDASSTATVQGDMYHGFERLVTGGTQAVAGGNLLGRWTRTWSPTADMSLQAYYDRTQLADPITNRFGTVQYLRDTLDTYDVDFQDRFAIGWRNEVTWGAGYRFTHDVVQNASNTAFLPPVLDRHLVSVFGQDALLLRPDLTLTLGTKLEHNDYTGVEVEPSVRLAWRFSRTQTLWSAVSRAVRMPSRIDTQVRQPNPPPEVIAGNPDFASETLIAYEAGYKAQLGTALSTSISAFFNQYDRLRTLGFAPAGSGPLVTFGNGMDAHTYGSELSAQYQVNPNWRLSAGYDYLVEHLHVKPGQNDLFGGRNEVSDPKHQVSLRSSWNLPGHIALDTALRWVDTLPTTGAPVPSYAEADVRIAWDPTDHLELSLVGDNLLHAHHPEFGIGTPLREEIQRSVYGKVSYRF